MGRDLDFEILNVMDFTSNRKRMSVVVRYACSSVDGSGDGGDDSPPHT